MPTFPITRPPLFGSYERGALKPSVARTAMEVGPPKVRRRSSRASRQLSAKYTITAGQAAEFEIWVRDDIGLGTETFDWPDPVSETTRAVRLAEDGYSLVQIAPGYVELSVTLEEWE